MEFNESLKELYEMALSLHLAIAVILIALIIIHFCLIEFGVNSPSYAKRIRLFLPTYYSFLAAMLMTGLLLMSVFYFHLSFRAVVMIVVWVFLIGLGVMEFKKLKVAMKSKNFIDFRKKMRFKILLDLALVLIASGVR
ncbi:hypothetical protein [Campylobacter sp. RM15925]|uniref:hypothetical protein n=1 Tax=Campylobacter sp. RM15925 TaxID=1705724 RepID=UPI0014762FE5|nr:hypothetical protein [Campylobacter sp. RM15925]